MLYYIVKNVVQSRNVFLFSLIIRLSNTSVFMRRIKLLFGKAVSSQNSKAAKASHQIFNSYNALSCKKSTLQKTGKFLRLSAKSFYCETKTAKKSLSPPQFITHRKEALLPLF